MKGIIYNGSKRLSKILYIRVVLKKAKILKISCHSPDRFQFQKKHEKLVRDFYIRFKPCRKGPFLYKNEKNVAFFFSVHVITFISNENFANFGKKNNELMSYIDLKDSDSMYLQIKFTAIFHNY